jgi:uncharacterized membrane protein
MFKVNLKLMTGAALSALLIAGCGGGGGSAGVTAPVMPVQQIVTSIVDFINNLIASNGENSEPIDINSLTVASDDNVDTAPL